MTPGGELLLVAALAAAPYARTLRAGWTYDDKVAVQGNPDVTRREVPLADVWAHDFWGNDMGGARAQGGWTHFSWRPLVTLSFRADFLRAGGALHARTFHATNVAIHVAACVAALWALRAVAGPRARGRALLAACLFALHPIHSECVANVTSRSDALAAVFQAVALALHATGPGVECPDGAQPALPAPALRGRWLALVRRGLTPTWRGARRFGGALLCTLLALACKETALVTPVLLVALDALRALGRARVRQQLLAAPARGAARAAGAPPPMLPCAAEELLRSGCTPRCAAYASVAGAAFVGRVLVLARGYDLARFANELHNPLTRLSDPLARALSVPFVQAFALSQLLLPLTLQHEHQAMALVHTAADPRNAFTGAVFALYAGVALLAAWRLGARATTPPLPATSRDSSVGGGALQPLKTQLHWQAVEAEAEAEAEAAADAGAAAVAARVGSGVRLAFGLAVVAIAYAPASHLLVYVAFTVAERTLFLPSLGACLLLAELAACAHEKLLAPLGRGGGAGGGGGDYPPWAVGPAPPPAPSPSPGKHKQQLPAMASAAGTPAGGGADTSSSGSSSGSSGGNGSRWPRGTAPVCRRQHGAAGGARWELRRVSWRAAAVPAAVAALGCFYACRTVARVADWADEAALLASSLAAYPANNAMS